MGLPILKMLESTVKSTLMKIYLILQLMEKKEEILEGYRAIVFQHELDHLNGILFVDHVKAGRKKMWKEIGDKMTEISYDELNLQD